MVIVPIPPKIDWSSRNKTRSFRCNSTINLVCTTHPNFDYFKFLLNEILKHPSASIRPVTNQGFNLSLLQKVENSLKINTLAKFNIYPHSLKLSHRIETIYGSFILS